MNALVIYHLYSKVAYLCFTIQPPPFFRTIYLFISISLLYSCAWFSNTLFQQEVEESFTFWGTAEGDLVHPAECMEQLLEKVRRHKVNIDGNVCTVMVTTLVLEVTSFFILCESKLAC